MPPFYTIALCALRGGDIILKLNNSALLYIFLSTLPPYFLPSTTPPLPYIWLFHTIVLNNNIIHSPWILTMKLSSWFPSLALQYAWYRTQLPPLYLQSQMGWVHDLIHVICLRALKEGIYLQDEDDNFFYEIVFMCVDVGVVVGLGYKPVISNLYLSPPPPPILNATRNINSVSRCI